MLAEQINFFSKKIKKIVIKFILIGRSYVMQTNQKKHEFLMRL